MHGTECLLLPPTAQQDAGSGAGGGMARTAQDKMDARKLAKKLLRERARLAGAGAPDPRHPAPALLKVTAPPTLPCTPSRALVLAEWHEAATAQDFDELFRDHGSDSDGEGQEDTATASHDGAGTASGEAADGPTGPRANLPPPPASSAAGHTSSTTCDATPTLVHVRPATAGAPAVCAPDANAAVARALRRVQQHPPAVMARRACRRPGCGRMTLARCSVRNKPACFFRRARGTEQYEDCFLAGLVPPDVLPWFAAHRPVPHSKVTHAGTPHCAICHRVASTRCASCGVPMCYYPRVKAPRHGGAGRGNLGGELASAPFRDCWLRWHLSGANTPPPPPPPPHA